MISRAWLFRWLPVVGYLGLITYLSSQTGSGLPSFWFMKFDKVLHTLEYGGLGFLVCHALGAWLARPRIRWLCAAAFGLAFGVVDEFHQSFVPGRQGNDPGDMLADLVGASLGALSFLVLAHLFSRLKQARPQQAKKPKQPKELVS